MTTQEILTRRHAMLVRRIEQLQHIADRQPARREDAQTEADLLGIELEAVVGELKRRKVAGY